MKKVYDDLIIINLYKNETLERILAQCAVRVGGIILEKEWIWLTK